jgi:hypothetical protein
MGTWMSCGTSVETTIEVALSLAEYEIEVRAPAARALGTARWFFNG